MSDRLVTFVDFETSTRKHTAYALVNPAHVGAVLPRMEFTTLVVHGAFIHVVGLKDEVLAKLGFEKEDVL